MAQATCRFCEAKFEYKPRTGPPPVRCDTEACRLAYRRNESRKYRTKRLASRPDKVCPECGQSFSPANLPANQRRKLYCSTQCGRAAHLRGRREREYQPIPINCAHCGGAIKYKSGKRRYCSQACQVAGIAKQARWRAKGIEPVRGVALRCALCGRADRKLVIDHDHKCCSGERACGTCFRGMLCCGCNVALGLLADSPRLLRKAARYIEDARRIRECAGQLCLVV